MFPKYFESVLWVFWLLLLSFGWLFSSSLPMSSISDNPEHQVKEPLAFIRKAQVFN